MTLLLDYCSPAEILPREHAWEILSKKGLEVARRAVRDRGVVIPPLIDGQNRAISGWVWVLAAQQEQLNRIPVLRAPEVTDDDLRWYGVLASRLAQESSFDEEALRDELEHLQQSLGNFDAMHLGFEQAELDRIRGLARAELAGDGADDPCEGGPPVSQLSDFWLIGPHRLGCADALMDSSFVALMAGERATFGFTDPPYNLSAKAISRSGRFGDFIMGAGEYSPAEFTRFVTTFMRHMAAHSVDGSLHAFFMSYHFLLELLRAGNIVFGRPKTLCTWVKSQGGQGSLYRAQTEQVAFFKKGSAAHRNNIQLGVHGRNRTTAWLYDGMNTPSAERDELLAMHITPKPIPLLRDAILDVTNRDDIVLDPFCGSGSIILAAHMVERRAYALELDPRYVDTALRRVRKVLGIEPIREADGALFTDLESIAEGERQSE
jgi:hypothetical protein